MSIREAGDWLLLVLFFMKLIGITGGIGSGKSVVCKILETLGYPVYYSDERARFLQHNDPEIISETKALLGDEAYIAGKLNRTYISARIFHQHELRQQLNAIVHPRVKSDFEKWKAAQNSSCIFQESALIFEISRQHIYDLVVLVTAPEELRVQRVIGRDKLHETEVRKRIHAQLHDEEKLKFNPYHIENDEQSSLLKQVLDLLESQGCEKI